MKLPIVELKDIKVVPEELIVSCAEQSIENNRFHKVLAEGLEYKLAGLTPVYLCKTDFKQLGVTSEERLTRKYH